jgi:hypothetical protein
MDAVDEEGEHPAPRKRRVDTTITAVTLLTELTPLRQSPSEHAITWNSSKAL